jgi:hypothetical protein
MKPMTRSLLAVASALVLPFCSNNPGNSNGGTADAGGINLNGKVVNPLGLASANVPVVIKGGANFSVNLVTDADGNFAVANVPTPYDAMVLDSPYGVTVSVGLTSATPTVLDMSFLDIFDRGMALTGPGGSASLSGTVTGGIGLPMPGGYMTSVIFASPELQTHMMEADSITGDYSTDEYSLGFDGSPIPISWSGPTTTTGTLHALQSQALIYGQPITYSGYGFKENVSLANGSAVTGHDIALTAVTPATFAGTYTPPAGYTVETEMVAMKFGSGGLMLIGLDSSASEAFSYSTPNIPGATLVLASTATKGDYAYSLVFSAGLAVDATGVAVASPAAAEGLAVSTSEVTTGTQFSWTAVPGAVHLVVIGSTSGYYRPVPNYVFLTSGTSATIPDLTLFGLSLPASTDYTWVVYGVGPYADVEAASAGLCCGHQLSFFNSLFGSSPVNYNLVNNTGGFLTASDIGAFTTPP